MVALHWNSRRREKEKLENALAISTKSTWRIVRHRWQRQRTFDRLRRRASARIFFRRWKLWPREIHSCGERWRAFSERTNRFEGSSLRNRCKPSSFRRDRSFRASSRLNHLRNQINIKILVKKKDFLTYLNKYISGANKPFVKDIDDVGNIARR